jgi:hypothetical protein
MAPGDFRWFLLRWGQRLFPEVLANIGDLEGIANSSYDRRLDEKKYWAVDDILDVLRQGLELRQSILSGETVGSLRRKDTTNPNTGNWAPVLSSPSPGHPSGPQ